MLRSVKLGNRWRLCGLALAIAGCADGEDAPEGERDGSVIADRDSAVVRRDDAAVVDASRMDAQLPATDANVAADASVVFASGPIRPTRYRVPEPVTQPCSGSGSGTVKTHEVLIGQTHLTPKAWPLQTVSANRPLTIAIAVSGSGSAPNFEASVTTSDGTKTACLKGADTLPSAADDLSKSLYRATIPAAWVAPGMSITVSGGGVSETLTPDVKAENGMTIYYVQARLFGEGTEPALPSAAQWTELAARLPTSYLDVGVNPFGVWKPKKLLIGSRDDARTPAGETTKLGPVIVAENPHCTAQDKTANKCTPHSGYGAMAGVLETLDAFRAANGVGSASTWYADLTVGLGGGLAGGQRGTGDNAELVMNHELGHAWGFPHWGASNTQYPYEGVRDGVTGGFGDRWAIDQARDLLLAPTCNGMERQSPLQRSGGSCVPDGSWYDPYTDYEAARLLRLVTGASAAVMGTVPYHGGKPSLNLGSTRAFSLQKEGGRLAMRFAPNAAGFSWAHYDEASNTFMPVAPDSWDAVAQSEVPVTMFAGALIYGGDSYFEEPLDYVGNVLGGLDPTKDADFATIKMRMSDDFYWAHDVVLRFTLDDQSRRVQLLAAGGELRANEDTLRFAFNLPQDVGHRVIKLEVLSRPLGQYNASSRLGSGDSAANYLAAAKVLATWTKP
jgi:hypothetical protein